MGKMKNIDRPIFAIDFEGSKTIGIVEYGVVKILGGEIAECATRICAPKTSIPAADAKFFDITDTRAKAFAPFSADISAFCRMRTEGIFAAHNAVAEDTMLRNVLPAPPIVENPLTRRQCASWSPYVDTCVLTKRLFRLDSAKLSNVVEKLELVGELERCAEKFCPPDRRKYHCALFDALACALVLVKICSFDGFENVTLGWLLKQSDAQADTQQNLL